MLRLLRLQGSEDRHIHRDEPLVRDLPRCSKRSGRRHTFELSELEKLDHAANAHEMELLVLLDTELLEFVELSAQSVGHIESNKAYERCVRYVTHLFLAEPRGRRSPFSFTSISPRLAFATARAASNGVE